MVVGWDDPDIAITAWVFTPHTLKVTLTTTKMCI